MNTNTASESTPVYRCSSPECGALALRHTCPCGASSTRLYGVPADQFRSLVDEIDKLRVERDRVTGEMRTAQEQYGRKCDDLELHRVAYKAANEELQDIYATIRPIQAEGNVKAVDVYRSLLDANSTLRVQLNAAVRAREILEEERTTAGVRAAEVAAENDRLRKALACALEIAAVLAPRRRDLTIDLEFKGGMAHAAMLDEFRKDPRVAVSSSARPSVPLRRGSDDQVPSL